MRDRLRKPVRWLLAAGYGLTSGCLLVVALHNAFFYFSISDHAFQISALRRAPCSLTKSYVGFVLADKKGAFRGASEKQDMLNVLVTAEDRGVRLCYDPRLVLPYLGEAAEQRYGVDDYESIHGRAENLVIMRRDPALIAAAINRYRTREPRVAKDLCWRLEELHPLAPDLLAVERASCPTRKPPAPEPFRSPEDLRRKEVFDKILEDSRSGRL